MSVLFDYRRLALSVGATLVALAVGRGACAQQTAPVVPVAAKAASETPPATWQEHWFEHNQLLKRVAGNGDVSLYFDDNVPATQADWMLPFLTELWNYTRKTYGPFGTKGGHLYAVFHQDRYSGGHPATYLDASHDWRNVIDCGPGPWDANRRGVVDIPSHEVAHIVEGASRGVRESPAFGIWHDSKWAEIYQYDAYRALKRDADAQRLYDKFMAGQDDFPRSGTHWFRDWFYPLWDKYGHARVMANYFRLLSEQFPTELKERDGRLVKSYTREMNWGEYIHFMSGAAGHNLKPLATQAFGWPDDWETQYQKARTEFPKIRYKESAK